MDAPAATCMKTAPPRPSPAKVPSSPEGQRASELRTLVLAGDRAPASVAFETDVVDFFVRAAELLGVPKSLAAIYGIVFASPTPVSFSDVCVRLDLSKGSISQGLRVLREVDAVQEVSAKEDPTELFIPNLEMRQLIGRYLAARLDPQLNSGRKRLDTLEKHLSSFGATERKSLGSRLRKLQTWHSKTCALLPLVRTFLKVG